MYVSLTSDFNQNWNVAANLMKLLNIKFRINPFSSQFLSCVEMDDRGAIFGSASSSKHFQVYSIDSQHTYIILTYINN
jgi:hypothetical protein